MNKRQRNFLSLCLALILAFCLAEPALAKDNSTMKFDPAITSNRESWLRTGDDIAGEGMVLLKNTGRTLPLARGTKINLLGYCAYNPVYSGSGSGAVSGRSTVDFTTALKNAGFSVNPSVAESKIYDDDLVAQAENQISYSSFSFHQREADPGKFTGEIALPRLKEYSDTAVVVLGRNAGEGSDLSSYNSVDGQRYLQLSKNEESLLNSARKTFRKLIVIINTGNALEMGGLAKYSPDAVVWCGTPGPYGLSALGKIIAGTVNPSGRLTDTWVYDNDANPSSETFAVNKASNALRTYYVDYIEGIYNGYRFYETASAEKAVIKTVRSGEIFDYRNYNSVVAYPFGYGLSYTTFDKKLSGGIPKNLKSDSKFDVKVKVKNTGKRAGKDVAQVYVTVPYTTYDKQHGVEKSAVSLVGFAKTKLLQPGESQTVKVPVDMQKIASYDTTVSDPNGKKGAYRLDAGDYIFSLRNDSHHVLDSKTANLKEDFVFNGANKRASDDQAAYNQFDQAARGKYLSRQNKFANYAEAVNSVSDKIKDMTYQNDPDSYGRQNDPKFFREYQKGADYDVPNGLKFSDMKGASYEDPRWNTLIKELSLTDLNNLVTSGLFHMVSLDSIGLPQTIETDGPQSWRSNHVKIVSGQEPTPYPAIVLLASTWNKGLAYTFGANMADEGHSYGISGWYAPAMDSHRNAYAGRNFEYYSEDPVLTGDMAKNEVLAARRKGLITYIKHFALNEMENNRGVNLHTYSNEQAIREIYLFPFEDCIKEGHSNAVMGSCNMVGDVFSNAYEPLMTQVLRNEWGFNGLVSTDYNQSPARYWYYTRPILRAGTDFWLDYRIGERKVLENPTSADIYYMQRAAKHILYTLATSDCLETRVKYVPNTASLRGGVFQ